MLRGSNGDTSMRWLYAATLAEFSAMGMFLAAIPLFVTEELGASRATAGISVGVFSISAIVLRPWIGRGIDRRGRKPFLVGALALLAASTPLFLVVHSVAAVVVLRIVHGVVGACFYTTAAAVTTDLAGPERRASAIARFSLFLYAGFALGPVLAETTITHLGFDWAWMAATALALLGLGAVLRLPETGTESMARRAELAEAGTEHRRLIHPAAIGPGLVLASAAIGYASITAFSPLYARHIGMSSSGALYVAFSLTIILVRVAALGALDDRSRVSIALPGLALGAVGLGTLALVQTIPAAFVGVMAFGAGFALVFPSLMAFTVDRVVEHERGEVLGSFTAFMDLGAGTGGYLVGTLADHAGFGWAYGVPALLCSGGFVLFGWIARNQARRQVPLAVSS